MERPVISCDVSKGSSHIQGFIGLSNPTCKPFIVHHVKSELKVIKEMIDSLQRQTHQKPVFVFEYTGVYHEAIIAYVSKLDIDIVAISPLESAKVRKGNIRPTKTDAMDCKNIAEVYYKRVGDKKPITIYKSDSSNNVKTLSRKRRSLLNDLKRIKVTYRRYLDLVWPCLDLYFKEMDGKVILTIVRTYKHPETIKRRTSYQIGDVLENNAHCRHKRSLELADKIKDYAKESSSGVNEKSEYVNCLMEAIDELLDKEKQIEEIENKLLNLVRKYPTYPLIKSIPGIGNKLAIVIASELGDYTRFKSAKQLVAYCGIDPTVLQSGTDDGKHYSISRKGNPILRSAIYLAVRIMIGMKDVDNQITEFFHKKKSSGLSQKASAVATSRKLLHVMYGMFTKGVCFETK